MALSEKSLDQLAATDLDDLIASGVQEGPRIEYKEATYGGSDADKREFLKDISSFANTFGGHLVIGISEVAGVASAIAPLAGDPDAEILRLESLVRDGLEPRVQGVMMR